MAIKRYVADKDNTITNAYKANLITRGTGSNMGSSDILEVFSIYGQASTSSFEASRVLIQFPINDISTDRTNSKIPGSGSVNFYMRMYNAPHGQPLAKGFSLVIRPISASWQEGSGLDMDGYEDETYEGIGSNWLFAASGTMWNEPGGDYLVGEHTDANENKGRHKRIYSASFPNGIEDLEVDVTNLVEDWISTTKVGAKSNYGVGVHLFETQETGSALADDASSYYTKKFFSRTSEFFFKRPVLEARWDSSIKDDRGNFFLSSALAPSDDNVNTLHFYNYVRGQLKDIPNVGTGRIYMSLHTGSNSSELSDRLDLPSGGDVSDPGTTGTYVTGGWVDTGIYSASFATTTSIKSTEYYYDVWYYNGEAANNITLFTGSGFVAQNFGNEQINPNPEYITSINNMKSAYSTKETARFRLHVRQKDWCPTIYTVASKEAENTIIDNAYYRVFRIVDDLEVVSYGTGSQGGQAPQTTGSADSYTRLSFDVSGNYFDFDMSLLQTGYSYGLKFMYYQNNSYHEQPEIFKFRVE